MRLVMVMSGGLDSTVAASALIHAGHVLTGLGFDYGQRHRRELDGLPAIWERLGMQGRVTDLRGVTSLLGGSSLTADIDVPHGHYAEEAMRVTVVPNRNMIMAAIAWGFAVAQKAEGIGLGVHGGDHFIYPDCRPEFVEALEKTLALATDGYSAKPVVLAPFLRGSKADIVKRGAELGAPMELTWTCYEGGEVHCGKCGACVERREAFQLAGVPDPTVYR